MHGIHLNTYCVSRSQKQNAIRNTDNVWNRKLTLGVGRSLAGTLEAGLLTFLDACISCQETAFTHGAMQLRIHQLQSTCQAHLYGASLASHTTTFDDHGHV